MEDENEGVSDGRERDEGTGDGGRGEGPRGRKRGEGKPAGAGQRAILKEERKDEKRRARKIENLGKIGESRKEKGRYVEKAEGDREKGRGKDTHSLRCCLQKGTESVAAMGAVVARGRAIGESPIVWCCTVNPRTSALGAGMECSLSRVSPSQ